MGEHIVFAMAENRKTVGMLAFVCGTEGGVRQYAMALIEALLLIPDYRFVLFTYPEVKGLERYGLEVRYVRPGSHFLKRAARASSATFGVPVPAFLMPAERAPFADIDYFFSPVASLYPHYYLKRPFAVSIHDLQERHFPRNFTWKERLFRAVVNRQSARRASTVVCESNNVKGDIVQFLGVDPAKVMVFLAPPPAELAEPSPEDLDRARERYRLPEQYIYFPAQFWFHKNHLGLLEAFRELAPEFPRLQIVFTGSKQNNYENVRQRIEVLGLESRVHSLGYLDYEDLAALYKLSTMVVLPQLFEGVSIPLYEAFTLGVPVCSSTAGALPEQAGDAPMFFDPRDCHDMAMKIRSLLLDPALAREVAARGVRRVREFSHERYAGQLRAMLEGGIR